MNIKYFATAKYVRRRHKHQLHSGKWFSKKTIESGVRPHHTAFVEQIRPIATQAQTSQRQMYRRSRSSRAECGRTQI